MAVDRNDRNSTLFERIAQTPHNDRANVATIGAVTLGVVGLAFPPAFAGAGACLIAAITEARAKEESGEKLDY